MSVTFTPEVLDSDLLGFRLTCVCDCEGSELLPTYEKGLALLERAVANPGDRLSYLPECSLAREDWEIFPASITAMYERDMPSLNMNNRNARDVLELLGISLDGDWTGTMSAEDLRGRVLLAQVLSPRDEGLPSYQRSQGTGPTMIEGARPSGYFQERLRELGEMAEWCASRNRRVFWG